MRMALVGQACLPVSVGANLVFARPEGVNLVFTLCQLRRGRRQASPLHERNTQGRTRGSPLPDRLEPCVFQDEGLAAGGVELDDGAGGLAGPAGPREAA